MIPLHRDLTAGESQLFRLIALPPNLSTPNGFTWDLLPTIEGSNFNSVTADQPAQSKVTAEPKVNLKKSGPGAFHVDEGGRGYAAQYKIDFGILNQGSSGLLGFAPNTTLKLVDTLPPEVEYVDHQTFAGVTSQYNPDDHTVTWTITDPANFAGTLPTSAWINVKLRDIQAPQQVSQVIGQKVTNKVDINFVALGGTVVERAAVHEVKIAGAPKFGSGGWFNKSSWGAANQTTTNPEAIITEPGVQPSFYELLVTNSPWAGRDDSSGTVSIVDPISCLSGSEYTASNGGVLPLPVSQGADSLCTEPAFIVDKVVVIINGDLAFIPDDLKFKAVLTDGTIHDFTVTKPGEVNAHKAFNVTAQNWPAPVSRIELIDQPIETTQNSANLRIRIYGTFPEGKDLSGKLVGNVGYFAISESDSTPITSDARRSHASIRVVDTSTRARTLANPTHNGLVGQPVHLGSQRYYTHALNVKADRTARLGVYLPEGFNVADPDAATGWQIEENFNGSGRTLLYQEYAVSDTAPKTSQLPIPTLNGPLESGVYHFETFVGFRGETPGSCSTPSLTPEANPVNGLTENLAQLLGADTSISFCSSSHQIVLRQPTPAFALSKMVKGADGNWLPSPGSNVLGPDGDLAEFRLQWTNTGSGSLSDVVIYDLLPRVGDHGVILHNSQRGSTMTPILQDVIAPANFEVQFSTSLNPCRPEVLDPADNPGCDSDWKAWEERPDDLSAVTALRFASLEPIASGSDPIDFLISMTAPADTVADEIAWNSAAAAATAPEQNLKLTPAETPKVGFGKVFDADIDVIKTTNGVDAPEPTGPRITEGAAVRWDYRVTNTGTEILANVEVTDDKVPAEAITCAGATPEASNVIARLAPGESVDCFATGVAELGQYENTVTTCGIPVTADGQVIPGAGKPCASYKSHYFGVKKSTPGPGPDPEPSPEPTPNPNPSPEPTPGPSPEPTPGPTPNPTTPDTDVAGETEEKDAANGDNPRAPVKTSAWTARAAALNPTWFGIGLIGLALGALLWSSGVRHTRHQRSE